MLQISQTEQLFKPKVKLRTASDIVSNGIVDIPAADANLILRECRYEKQTRDLTSAGELHKRVLCELMRKNQWRKFEKIDFVRIGDQLFVINGYHRLGAQVLAGVRVTWIFVIHECATREEADALYHTFDTNIKARTTEQILNVIGAADLLGVSKSTVKAVYGAVPLIIAGFDFSRAAADPLVHRLFDLRMEKVKSFQQAAIAWEKATEKAPAPVKVRLRTQGALSVALVCFQSCEKEAERFWGGVAHDDGLRVGDPRKTYLAALRSIGNNGTAYTLAIQTAIAWNAWYADRDLKIIKIAQNAKFRIAGTLWD